jgi:GNAT superfamily N-acetyltransferase
MSLTIRKATLEDVKSLATIHVVGWQGAYGGIMDQAYIDSQTIEKRTADWSQWIRDNTVERWLAFEDEKPVGLIAYGPLRTAPPGTSSIRPLYTAEIYALYILPKAWRKGVGSALLNASVQNLLEQKHTSMCLWVLDKNKRACAFYEKMGGQRVGKKMVEFGPSTLKEVCYGWRDIKTL